MISEKWIDNRRWWSMSKPLIKSFSYCIYATWTLACQRHAILITPHQRNEVERSVGLRRHLRNQRAGSTQQKPTKVVACFQHGAFWMVLTSNNIIIGTNQGDQFIKKLINGNCILYCFWHAAYIYFPAANIIFFFLLFPFFLFLHSKSGFYNWSP